MPVSATVAEVEVLLLVMLPVVGPPAVGVNCTYTVAGVASSATEYVSVLLNEPALPSFETVKGPVAVTVLSAVRLAPVSW